jgi:uncharacterized protein YjbI with pentapeptide repeats
MDPVRPSRPSGGSIWTTPFLWVNWVCEWVAYVASNFALFQILEYAGKLGILIAVITYFADYEKRRQADIRAAWSVVNIKGGGRKKALEYLASQNDVDLRGLYGGGGFFSEINLEGRNLSGSDLENANFDRAIMNGAIFQGSNLSGASFKDAHLDHAQFQNSHFYTPPFFDGADLNGADFSHIVGAGPSEYLGFVGAKNIDNATFGPGVKEFIKCVVNKSNADGSSKDLACEAQIPPIVQSGDSLIFLNDVMMSVYCQLRNAVFDLHTGLADMKTGIESWGVQTTLSLAYDERAAASPNSTAARREKVSTFQLVADLMKSKCPWLPEGNLLLTDLKLKEWLFDVVQNRSVRGVAPITDAGPPTPSRSERTMDPKNAFQHEVGFVVVQDRTPGSSISSLAGRRQAYNLLVTFGPVDNGRLGPQANNLHLSALTSLGIESEAGDTLQR